MNAKAQAAAGEHGVTVAFFAACAGFIRIDGERGVSAGSIPWFRIGGRGERPSCATRVNRKFTKPPVRGKSTQICGELSSRQSVAVYRGLLGRRPFGITAGEI
jgi:hypothetical protein